MSWVEKESLRGSWVAPAVGMGIESVMMVVVVCGFDLFGGRGLVGCGSK